MYNYPHFLDEETEAQSRYVLCPRLTVHEVDSKGSSLVLQIRAFIHDSLLPLLKKKEVKLPVLTDAHHIQITEKSSWCYTVKPECQDKCS